MLSLRILLAVLVCMSWSFPAIAEECDDVEAGFERGECYLDQDRTRDYFNYVSVYYNSEAKDSENYDPRLGFRFIEKVVRHDRGNLVALASEIYDWGLNANEVEPYKELLEREINYMAPVLTSSETEQLEAYLEENDPQIYQKIRGIWNTRDVIMSSDVNERLIEHWERIIHAKENYTKNDTTVYGTDERGEIYVRLGEPTNIETGKVGQSNHEVRAKLYDLQNKGHINPDASEEVFRLQQHIMSSVIPADFELWQYYDVTEIERDNIFFLFGRRGGNGEFGLRNSVEEFISNSVFNNSAYGARGRGSDVRIGTFLQFVYYNDLSTYDRFFGNRLQEYDRAWHRSVGFDRVDGHTLRNRISRSNASRATQQVYNRAPGDTSLYERRLEGYDFEYRHYRFLDEQGRPELISFINSDPGQLFGIYKNIPGTDESQNYEMHLKQGVVHHTADNQAKDRHITNISRVYDSSSGPANPTNSAHKMIASADDTYSILFSELYFGSPGQDNEPDNWSLVGMNKQRSENPERLNSDGEELLLSDIILGSTGEDTVRVRDELIGILKNEELVQGDNLQVMFEAYNFKNPDTEYVPYQIEYRIEDGGRSWWPFSGSDDEQSLTWEAVSDGWNDSQFFEVEHSNLDPGSYTLHIKIEETESGRQAERSIDFEVVEPPEDVKAASND